MNKWVVIPIITVLAIGVIASGVSCQTNDSVSAPTEIVALEANISTLEADLAAAEAEVSTLEARASTLEADLAAAEAGASAPEADLAAAEARVSTLETELAAAEARVSALETALAATEAQISTVEAQLMAALARISALETEPPAAPSTYEVIIDGRAFSPPTITVPVGTTVTWTNLDAEAHTITSDTDLFNASVPPGESFSYTFTEPCNCNYYCTLHDNMTGTVTVEAGDSCDTA